MSTLLLVLLLSVDGFAAPSAEPPPIPALPSPPARGVPAPTGPEPTGLPEGDAARWVGIRHDGERWNPVLGKEARIAYAKNVDRNVYTRRPGGEERVLFTVPFGTAWPHHRFGAFRADPEIWGIYFTPAGTYRPLTAEERAAHAKEAMESDGPGGEPPGSIQTEFRTDAVVLRPDGTTTTTILTVYEQFDSRVGALARTVSRWGSVAAVWESQGEPSQPSRAFTVRTAVFSRDGTLAYKGVAAHPAEYLTNTPQVAITDEGAVFVVSPYDENEGVGGLSIMGWSASGEALPRRSVSLDHRASEVDLGMVACGAQAWVLVGQRDGETEVLQRYAVTTQGVEDPVLLWSGPAWGQSGNGGRQTRQYATGCHDEKPAVAWVHPMNADGDAGWVMLTW